MKLIEGDNKFFKFAITDPRIKFVTKEIVHPIPPKGDENKKFVVKEDELTLPSGSVGRLENYYDFSGMPIWGADAEDKITQKEWKPLINVIWSTWDSAHALSFLRIPETQQEKAYKNKSKVAQRLCRLSDAAHIRSNGKWCSGDDATVTSSVASYKNW